MIPHERKEIESAIEDKIKKDQNEEMLNKPKALKAEQKIIKPKRGRPCI